MISALADRYYWAVIPGYGPSPRLTIVPPPEYRDLEISGTIYRAATAVAQYRLGQEIARKTAGQRRRQSRGRR